MMPPDAPYEGFIEVIVERPHTYELTSNRAHYRQIGDHVPEETAGPGQHRCDVDDRRDRHTMLLIPRRLLPSISEGEI